MPGLTIFRCDGTVFRESYDTFAHAVAHARSGRGPAIVHSRVVRLMSHSSTDDQRKYRTKADVEWEFERDPIPRLARELIAYEIATPQELLAIHDEVEREIAAAVEQVLREPKTDTAILVSGSYAPPGTADREYGARFRGRRSAHAGQRLVLAEAINRCLDELMECDDRIVMWGEDIADFSRGNFRYRDRLDGKGGVFGVTKGLQRKYGPDRVFNAPIAEATIVGKATGYALAGFLPIVEIQFRDYLNPAWQQLVDFAATLRFRSGGAFACPMVVRMSYGSYLGGAGALWHSESAVGPLLNYPGLRVCVASNPRDAVGLLREAAYCGDPVVYCEPKALYRRKDGFMDQPYPDIDYRVPLGRARVYGEGRDLCIVTYGTTAPVCWNVKAALEAEGVGVRMLDLLWLAPMDEEAIRTHAAETGRVLIVEEDRRAGGAGATIADAILKDRALRRRVDIERVAAKDCRVSYGPVGERAVVPQEEDILAAARAVLGR
jgi:2-oxoisovalerate dehydrogenase E1 component